LTGFYSFYFKITFNIVKTITVKVSGIQFIVT
jgi:hypothetical protein